MPRILLSLFLLASTAVFSPLAVQGQSLTFKTLAGPQGGAGVDDGRGSAARFYYPSGVATDSSGNVYVADAENHTIRKISPAGMVTTLAGLAGNVGSADGTGSAARFISPRGVATDSKGNLYVSDGENSTIRKISPSGAVTTLAGLPRQYGSADGTGSSARFWSPSGLAIDSSGNVYVADTENHTIRKITPGGTVTTFAGLAGHKGSVDGTGSAAQFNYPSGLAIGSSGNIYIADSESHTIRKISPAGAVTTVAGRAGRQWSISGDGFDYPDGVTIDSSGNLYVTDSITIRKINPAGSISYLVGVGKGSVDGVGMEARFNSPSGLAFDSNGNLYVADMGNHTIRRITPSRAVTTLAGLATGNDDGSTDGTGSVARFKFPAAVATHSSGNVYVADDGNATIRKISTTGEVTTLAGLAGSQGSADGTGSAARFYCPRGVATDRSENVYVADPCTQTIRKISPTGVVTTLAGLADQHGSADGTGSEARFAAPYGVATDNNGNVYVADSYNKMIRKVSPAGVVTTLAGLAESIGSADGTGSTARFYFPIGVAADSSGNVYVADTHNHTIRKISPPGEVTTLAGLAGIEGSADGTGSAARFSYPHGVATDSAGNVYVADSFNYTIRKISPAGVVTTLGGLADRSGRADGTGSGARFTFPTGVATDSGGNVYVADTNNHRIRIGGAVLADVATIDASTGWSGSTRLLDPAPQTATSWQWTVVRRPADSVAILSSESVRNPTFTPDVSGLFTFRLIATGTGAVSISTVDLVSQANPRRRAAGK